MKKIFIFCLLTMSVISSVFGQDMIWTTMSSSPYRYVSLNSVKSQILSVSNQFNFFWYDDAAPFTSRANYIKTIESHNIELQNSRNITQAANNIINQNNQLLYWLNNNQDFVYAIRTEIRSFDIDSYNIQIINGDRVYHINFQSNNPSGNAYSSRQNLDWLNRTLDTYLGGMISSSSQGNTNGNRSTFTITNYTGYSIHYAYIQPVTTDTWGQDWLGDDQTIPDGQSVSWYLTSSMNSGTRYDILLKDLDGDTYSKRNILITPNSTILFLFNDIDER